MRVSKFSVRKLCVLSKAIFGVPVLPTLSPIYRFADKTSCLHNRHMSIQNISLKIPPHSVEAEMALLGSIMLRPEVFHDVFDIVHEDGYYSEKHRIIWRGMRELFLKHDPIDLLTISTRLREKNLLDAIGGASYLTELVNSVPSSTNATHYAEIVHKKFIMRKLIDCSEHIGALGYEEAYDLEMILDGASKKLFEVTSFAGSGNFIALNEALEEAWERLDKLHQDGADIRGVATGFKQLDNKLAGLQKSDLIILAARPSCGKTSLALDIVRHAAIKSNVPTLVFSLEMSTQQLVDRLLAAEAKVDAWRLRTGKLNMENEFVLLRDKLESLSKAPIYVDDQPANNIMKMRSVARRLKMEKGLGLIVVDYLQLMAPVHSKNNDNMVNQITEISRSLKQLAREMDVPVLALSQLSRAVEQRGGKPRLSDLRDSGSIEQDADVVMFIHKEEKYNETPGKATPVEILIEKHRNGPTGMVNLMFNSVQSTFIEPDTSNYGAMQKDVGEF